MKKNDSQLDFMLCIKNDNSDDLSLRKFYQVYPLSLADKGYIRVIDDSGEDYLYPANYFLQIELPQRAEQALLATA